MRQRVTPDTASSTAPEMWVDDDGVNHWVALDTDGADPQGQQVRVYSHDLDAVIEALQQARDVLAGRGAPMEFRLDPSWTA